MNARGEYQTTDLAVLRVRAAARREERRRVEREVEKDIADRRRQVRADVQLKFNHAVHIPVRRSDLSYWKTKLSGPDKIHTPEECKAIRNKPITHAKYQNSAVHAHAVEGFVYWVKRDNARYLSKDVGVRRDKMRVCVSDSMGPMKPDAMRVQF